MSYGGDLSGKRRYSALAWTSHEGERPRQIPVTWTGLEGERPRQIPVAWNYRVPAPPLEPGASPRRVSPEVVTHQYGMAKEVVDPGRGELGAVTNGGHQDTSGTSGGIDGARPVTRRLDDTDTARKTLDPNRYATKKTIAQGMLDVALLTANASQLRYVLQVGEGHEFYTLMVTLISLSIILQVMIGLLAMSLNLLRDCRVDKEEFSRSANGINYTSLAIVFVITTTNVLISAFDVRPVGAARAISAASVE